LRETAEVMNLADMVVGTGKQKGEDRDRFHVHNHRSVYYHICPTLALLKPRASGTGLEELLGGISNAYE
jgi:hypothetical protein